MRNGQEILYILYRSVPASFRQISTWQLRGRHEIKIMTMMYINRLFIRLYIYIICIYLRWRYFDKSWLGLVQVAFHTWGITGEGGRGKGEGGDSN